MPTGGYQIRDQHAIHFITFIKDVANSYFFWNPPNGIVFVRIAQTEVVAADTTAAADTTVADTTKAAEVADFKKYTSSRIIQAIEANERESRRNWMLWIFRSAGQKNQRNEKYQFWQQDNHPIECFSPEVLESKMKYLHENPLRAGIVRNEWEYVYSSAIDYYCDGKGLLELMHV